MAVILHGIDRDIYARTMPDRFLTWSYHNQERSKDCASQSEHGILRVRADILWWYIHQGSQENEVVHI